MEAVPAVSRLAVLWDATIGEAQFRATETAPRPGRIVLQSLPIRRQQDIDESIQQAARDQANGTGGAVIASDLSAPLADRLHRFGTRGCRPSASSTLFQRRAG